MIFIIVGLLLIALGIVALVYKPSNEQKKKTLFKKKNLNIIGGIILATGVIFLGAGAYEQFNQKSVVQTGFRFY